MASPTPSRPARRRRWAAAALPVLALALVTGCGSAAQDGSPGSTSGGGRTEDTSGKPVVVDVRIKGEDVSPAPAEVDLQVGQKLVLQVDSDRVGELHVHSDPEHTYDVGSGQSTFTVSFDKPGSVDVEEHESDTLVVRALVE